MSLGTIKHYVIFENDITPRQLELLNTHDINSGVHNGETYFEIPLEIYVAIPEIQQCNYFMLYTHGYDGVGLIKVPAPFDEEMLNAALKGGFTVSGKLSRDCKLHSQGVN